MKRGSAAIIMAAALLVGALGGLTRCSRQEAVPVHKPRAGNVVLIVLDTVRADRLGCYGNTRGLTPHLDRFARESVRFEQAFSHAPWTLPAVASLLTSRYPVHHGAGGRLGALRGLPPAAVMLPEVFQRAGLATGAVVNVAYLTESFGTAQGLDTVDAKAWDSNVQVRRAGPTTDAALAWVRSRGDGPFFILVHYFDPHLIYDPPPPFRQRFADPQDTKHTSHLFGRRGDMEAVHTGRVRLKPGTIRRLAKLHDGEVAYVDSEVGRLLAAISELGLDDNTVVVVIADHGEEFFDHGGFEHGHTVYDELLHTPLLIRAPGLSPTSVSTTVRHIDVAPTLCELVGVEPDPAFLGRSLLPLLQGIGQEDRPVLSQGNFWGPSRQAWRHGDLKLVQSAAPAQVQLFDIKADPGELHDLAAEAPEALQRMTDELELVLQALSAEATTGPAPVLTPEQIEQLRSLGYLK